MSHDPLAHLYPIWEANCRESARWLRSGPEIEAWYARRGLVPVAPDVATRTASVLAQLRAKG